jgi:hypothetical protein
VNRGPQPLPLDVLLFEELFDTIEFKSHETLNWESTRIEPHNGRPHNLDIASLDTF